MMALAQTDLKYAVVPQVVCMSLLSLMGAIITYNSPPRVVSCTIELQYTDHSAIYAGKGDIHD